MLLAHSTIKGVGRPPKPPLSQRLNLALPSGRLRENLPLPREQARESIICFHSLELAAQVPVKLCMNFLSGLLPISIN